MGTLFLPLLLERLAEIVLTKDKIELRHTLRTLGSLFAFFRLLLVTVLWHFLFVFCNQSPEGELSRYLESLAKLRYLKPETISCGLLLLMARTEMD